jgi:hypothetical protein
MPEQDGLNPAERELEEALRSLAPVAARIDSVSAAFEAGRRSTRRQVHLWRAATAAALLIGVGSWLIPIGPSYETSVQIVDSGATPLVQPLAAQSVTMLQAAYRNEGLAGLPPTQLPTVGSGRLGDML